MKTMIAVAAAALCASAATAQDVGDTSIAFGVSGFGGSVEAAYRIDPSVGVRGAYWGGVSLSYEEDDGETDIEGDVRLGGLALLADYYPTQSGWRISGGVFFSTGEFEASGTENVSGTEQQVTTSAEFNNDVSPMIATGYEFEMLPQWNLNIEAGVIFTGGINVDFTADDPDAQDDVDNDQDLQDIKDDLENLGIFPHVGLTVAYKF